MIRRPACMAAVCRVCCAKTNTQVCSMAINVAKKTGAIRANSTAVVPCPARLKRASSPAQLRKDVAKLRIMVARPVEPPLVLHHAAVIPSSRAALGAAESIFCFLAHRREPLIFSCARCTAAHAGIVNGALRRTNTPRRCVPLLLEHEPAVAVFETPQP